MYIDAQCDVKSEMIDFVFVSICFLDCVMDQIATYVEYENIYTQTV